MLDYLQLFHKCSFSPSRPSIGKALDIVIRRIRSKIGDLTSCELS